MKASLVLLPVLLAGAAGAAPVPPSQLPPGGPAAQAGAPAPQMRKIPGVSDAGNAILARDLATPDPQFATVARQQKAVRDQIVPVLMAGTVDVDKLGALLKQNETLLDQARQHQTDRILAVAKKLPDADRGPFLRAVLMPGGQGQQPPR